MKQVAPRAAVAGLIFNNLSVSEGHAIHGATRSWRDVEIDLPWNSTHENDGSWVFTSDLWKVGTSVLMGLGTSGMLWKRYCFFQLEKRGREGPFPPNISWTSSSTSLDPSSTGGRILNAISARQVVDQRLEIRILSWPNTEPDDHGHRTEDSRHCWVLIEPIAIHPSLELDAQQVHHQSLLIWKSCGNHTQLSMIQTTLPFRLIGSYCWNPFVNVLVSPTSSRQITPEKKRPTQKVHERVKKIPEKYDDVRATNFVGRKKLPSNHFFKKFQGKHGLRVSPSPQKKKVHPLTRKAM